jgi:hypothetical protein
MTVDRDDLASRMEVALVDWKPLAQPHELAELAELLLDVKDAADGELEALEKQFSGLEKFMAARKASSAGFKSPAKP